MPKPFRHARPLYLGIEIGGTKLQLGVGSDDGTLAAIERLDVRPSRGAVGILEQIETAARALAARHHVAAIGFGFGGPVDSTRGVVIKSHHVDGWERFPLVDWCRRTLGLAGRVGKRLRRGGLAEARHRRRARPQGRALRHRRHRHRRRAGRRRPHLSRQRPRRRRDRPLAARPARRSARSDRRIAGQRLGHRGRRASPAKRSAFRTPSSRYQRADPHNARRSPPAADRNRRGRRRVRRPTCGSVAAARSSS